MAIIFPEVPITKRRMAGLTRLYKSWHPISKNKPIYKCERCPAMIKRGIYCKPCKEDIRIEKNRLYERSKRAKL